MLANSDSTHPYGDSPPLRITPQDAPGLVPGELVDGTYRVLSQIGAGSMGMVFHAIDEQLDREVALKLITNGRFCTQETIDRFRSEARAMARIRHPNVVEIYAFGTHNAVLYFAMEMIPGPNLAQWHVENAPLPIDEAVNILAQLATGITAIHQAGTVHRDLKPSNTIIGPSDRAVITDLGLARVQGQPDHYANATVAGTPAYMAPECGQGLPPRKELESRADVYSLGVMAFELLTGQRPFTADDTAAMLEQHALFAPPLPSSVRLDLPKVFDLPIMMAMGKNPAFRTASSFAFRTGLLRAYGQRHARPPM